MTASTRSRRPWNISRSPASPIGPERPSNAARPSAVAMKLTDRVRAVVGADHGRVERAAAVRRRGRPVLGQQLSELDRGGRRARASNATNRRRQAPIRLRAMDFRRLDRGELIAVAGGFSWARRCFWRGTGSATPTRSSTTASGPDASCTGWEALTILRFLLLIAAVAPLILAWIIVRGHALSWPRGELTAVVALVALTFTLFRGVIDRPGRRRARSASATAGGSRCSARS